MSQVNAKQILFGAYQAALNVADPQIALPKALEKVFPDGLKGKCLVIGAGKASASMADAFEKHALSHWPKLDVSGVVVTRYHHDMPDPIPSRKISVLQAAHPVPDQACVEASKEILKRIEKLNKGDHLIVLISGGGSSLLTLPVAGIELSEMQILTQALLKSGAPIEQMNVVRKHLSQIQGGNLARLAVSKGVRVQAFIISDVIGDHPADIASGPCAVDPSTYQDAINVLHKYQLDETQISPKILQHLRNGVLGKVPETLKETDPELNQIDNYVYATAMQSLAMAAKYCDKFGIQTIILGDRVSGESKEQAIVQLNQIKELLKNNPNQSFALISGGETTVTIPPNLSGRGGRCAEFLLALLDAGKGMKHLFALAADTDGIDGSENNAGAYFDQDVLEKVDKLNLDSQYYLKIHDSYGFFSQAEGLVMTGPTLSNVNDFRILLINLN
jgi:hydroxypyruvate reductase